MFGLHLGAQSAVSAVPTCEYQIIHSVGAAIDFTNAREPKARCITSCNQKIEKVQVMPSMLTQGATVHCLHPLDLSKEPLRAHVAARNKVKSTR